MRGITLAALFLLALAALAGDSPVADKDVIPIKIRKFNIPTGLDSKEKALLEEVRLLVSRDQGKTWKKVQALPAEEGVRFPFTAPENGLYWFAFQYVLKDGTETPTDPRKLVPRLKVLVSAEEATSEKEPAKLPPDAGADLKALREMVLGLERRVAELEKRLTRSEQESLQGLWKVLRFIGDGTEVAEKEAQELRFVFKESRLILSGPDLGLREFSFKLNPGAGPGAIDVTSLDGAFKGVTVPALFDLEGETLRFCMPNQETKTRPTRFEAPAGSGLGLFILRRAERK